MTQDDLFVADAPIRSGWVITCGEQDRSGNFSLLRDNFIGEGVFVLIFSSQAAADREAKAMNKIRGGMRLEEIYKVAKLKPEWIDGLPCRRVH
jgi:hypothetical protein